MNLPFLRRAAAAIICLLTVHCSSEDDWTSEGRVFAALEADVVAAPGAFDAATPLSPGFVAYRATFEPPTPVALGEPQTVSEALIAYLEVALDRPVMAGDEVFFCEEFLREEKTFRSCFATLYGSGATEYALPEGAGFRGQSFSSRATGPVQRVVLEIHRPTGAPSLEGSRWKLALAQQACVPALDARLADAVCAQDAACTTGGSVEHEIDATSCRSR